MYFVLGDLETDSPWDKGVLIGQDGIDATGDEKGLGEAGLGEVEVGANCFHWPV